METITFRMWLKRMVAVAEAGLPEVKIVERLSYCSANGGTGLLFGLTGSFLLYFYTDIYHVSAAIVGTLFLVARAVDALFDPLLGLLIDRTKTRFGKNRPYLIIMALPFALSGVAVFWAPGLTGTWKIVYIFVSYTIMGVLYSCVSLPLNSMLPSLSSNSRERTDVNVLREFFGSGATIAIGFGALPLVAAFGGGDQVRGFLLLAVLCAVAATICLTAAFLFTRERHVPPQDRRVLTWRQSLIATRANWPWRATMLVNFFFWVGWTAHVQSTVYYARDVMKTSDQVPRLMGVTIFMLLGIGAAAFLTHHFEKRAVGTAGSLIAAAAFALIPISNAPIWVLSCNAVANMGLGLIGGLLFALMADAVDYGEWKNGYRAQGFLYAASSLGVKLGLSVGGAAGAWSLASAGYVSGLAPTQAVIHAIVGAYVMIPAVAVLAMAASLTMFRMEAGFGSRRPAADIA